MAVQNGQDADASDIINSTATYAADAGASDTYAISLPVAPASYVTGAHFRFKANTANTGPATLNVNSLGAKTIKKNYDVDLADGDIKASQIVSVVYDGTNFQLLSPVAPTLAQIASNTFTKLLTATTTTTIAHGLGVVPRLVLIKGLFLATNYINNIDSIYANSAQKSSSYIKDTSGTGLVDGGQTTYVIGSDTSNYLTATVAVDATNITITYASTAGSPTGTATLFWTALA